MTYGVKTKDASRDSARSAETKSKVKQMFGRKFLKQIFHYDSKSFRFNHKNN